MALAVGQLVYLNSGSPAMTVEQVMDKSVSCKWFNGGQVQRDNFPEAALTLNDPRPAVAKTEAATADELAKVP